MTKTDEAAGEFKRLGAAQLAASLNANATRSQSNRSSSGGRDDRATASHTF